MNKLNRAYNILKSRLPKDYIIPIKTYKTTKSMLKAVAKIDEIRNYKDTVIFYNNYFKNPKTNTYVDTKYYKTENEESPITAFDIIAFGGNPILISLELIKMKSLNNIVYILLHEIGHVILNSHNENQCDNFAIRWTRKLLKEKLIK